MIHVFLPADIEDAKKRRVDLMFQKGLTVQPYVITVGPSLSNITSAVVVINDYEYKCSSVLKALDFCFKCYHILDAKYPFQTQHFWYLIQWKVYKLFCKTDQKIPYINDLLSEN